MTKNKYFSLDKWIEIADEAYADSRELMYKKLSTKKPLNIPAYLLHWSMELYLKAYLMQNEVNFERSGAKGHDLIGLFKKCLVISPKMENLSKFQQNEKEGQSYWLDLVNEYGKERGGIKYLNKNRENWSFYVLIHDRLDNLVKYIKDSVDKSKDITELV